MSESLELVLKLDTLLQMSESLELVLKLDTLLQMSAFRASVEVGHFTS